MLGDGCPPTQTPSGRARLIPENGHVTERGTHSRSRLLGQDPLDRVTSSPVLTHHAESHDPPVTDSDGIVISLTFHGAAQTVTGSKYLVQAGARKLLIDCGIFQGKKQLRERNWSKPAFDPAAIEWIVLTHAHTDHTAYLPRLYKLGFRGRIFCSAPTQRLAEILLLDAAHLQEEDARFLNKKKATRHKPALPLFDSDEVEAVLRLFHTVEFGVETRLSPSFAFRLRPVGHILGAGSILLSVTDGDDTRTIYFSGDVGRYDMPLLPDPQPPLACDYLVLESTYGDRLHEPVDPFEELAVLCKRTAESGGVLLIPAFAVGRAQQLVYCLRVLMEQKRVPALPIHVDSPMAIDATRIFCDFPDLHRVAARDLEDPDCALFGDNVRYIRSRDESIELNDMPGPRIIISASGMLTGGRILHHLIHQGGDPRNIIALAGFQAEGTRGRDLHDGKRALRFHGYEHEIRAEVIDLGGFSGHADYAELMKWLEGIADAPRLTYITHGEPGPAQAMAERVSAERRFSAHAPHLGETVEL